MRVAFFGTPEFALPTLEALYENHELVLVVTRPDAVRSRGKKLEASPVKMRASELGVEMVEAQRISPELNEYLRELNLDAIVVAAFGCIIPKETLAIPRLECVNVHGSLLPRWRGAAPIQRAILARDKSIGISIMRVVKALDAGPYCRQASLDAADMSFEELSRSLAQLGAFELLAALDDIEQGSAEWIEQDETQVSYAEKISKQELLLNPEMSARDNLSRVRASSDTAPARAEVCGRKLRVCEARVVEDALSSGEVLCAGGRLVLGCAQGALELISVKPDGKREMTAAALVAGLKGVAPLWSSLS
ncbi:MAG: methionyl-tRNA formyltransferase [Atopobiaceae bacterium]|nr:methionyl-tRNA formyltransferase [Atopobiaceae bacterium]